MIVEDAKLEMFVSEEEPETIVREEKPELTTDAETEVVNAGEAQLRCTPSR